MHILLEQQFQKIGSNQEKAFFPEEKDMLLNTAILSFVKSCFQGTNALKTGMEQSSKRITDLKNLVV